MSDSARRILGQDRAIATLTRALASGHLQHAWIFHGPFGVGKCATALDFAALLLDPAATEADVAAFAPPRTSRVAQLMAAGTHPDLHLIRKERAEDSQLASLRDKKQTNIPIDLLRELMIGGSVDGKTFDGPIWRTAYAGHGKVFIIDEAELLDHVGQNALLKTLEEPPPFTYIVLLTTREDRLLPTILSRCQRVSFTPLNEVAMRTWLASAPFGRDAGIGRDALAWIERFAEGSPGLATLAVRFGVQEWATELAKPVAQLSTGSFVGSLAEAMNGMLSGCSDEVVKANAKASKEAANRLAARLLFGVLGQYVRDAIAGAARDGDIELAERWTGIVDVLTDADEQIRRHLNQKHVLANLVAQWAARAPLATHGAVR